MNECEVDVQKTLLEPDEVRRSRSDRNVYLFYKREKAKRWVCAVVKKHINDKGYLITAYPTDKIKEGDLVWSK